EHPHPRPACPLLSLGEQGSLADTGRAGDHYDATTTSPRGSKQPVDARQLTLALQQAARHHPEHPSGGRQTTPMPFLQTALFTRLAWWRPLPAWRHRTAAVREGCCRLPMTASSVRIPVTPRSWHERLPRRCGCRGRASELTGHTIAVMRA